MKLQKFLSGIISASMLLSLALDVSAEFVSNNSSKNVMIQNTEFITEDWGNIDYIGIDEYITKYGGESVVNKLFNQAEIKHEAMLLRAEGKESDAASLLSQMGKQINKTSDLLLSIKEEKFLGLEIVGITDLPPDNINLSFKVKGEISPNTISTELSDPVSYANNMSMTRSNLYVNRTHSDGSAYRILYSDACPSSSYIDNYVYEDYSGSYFYKYGYSWTGDYRCTTELTFDNTTLKTGTQTVNMYAFIGALTGAAVNMSVDFGLMASPTAYNRNQGLYGFRYFRGNDELDVDAYPKVNIVGSSTNPMTLEEKTIKLELVIDEYGEVGTKMYLDNTLIYYKSEVIPGFVSGNDEVLTFFQAMSCTAPNEATTNPSSGAYFKNVSFSNTKLCNGDSGERAFGTYGNDTYYVYICKPEDISYSYGTNSEMVSIEYN